MKRLLLLSLLLLPASIYALGEMAEQYEAQTRPAPGSLVLIPPAPPAPPTPVAPAAPEAPPVVASVDGVATAVACEDDPDDEDEDALDDERDHGRAPAPWFQPPSDEPASQRFRFGIPATVRRVIREKQRQVRALIAAHAPRVSPDERAVVGMPKATPERAIEDAYKHMERAVSEWIAPEVPATWRAPKSLIEPMARKPAEVEKVERDYGTLYRATLRCDFSPARRAEIVRAYESKVVMHRLGILGVVLAFVMACLAAFAAYVRADEATRGYYTNRLRLAAAAGVGAAGMAAYHLLT